MEQTTKSESAKKKTTTFTRRKPWNPETTSTVTRTTFATRQDGVQAKLAEWIRDAEARIAHDQALLVELRKLKPTDYASVVELREAYGAALVKVSV